jgi:cell division protein FtsX
VATVIRHTLAEGWVLLRQRFGVSMVLALSLSVPISLAGVGLTLHFWLGPAAGMTGQASVVAVLLHPRLDHDSRSQWINRETTAHPEWEITEVSREALVDRLERWFPYLEELVDDGDDSLPPLVEIMTSEPESVSVLENRPEVLAIGPRSSVQQLLAVVARRFSWGLAIVSGVLLAAAMLLAAVWVHLELYRHADEIAFMRLVGATELTIRGPFLVAVGVPGALAGVLSIAGSMVIVGGLSRMATTVGLPAINTPTAILGLQAGAGLILPLATAANTLMRHAADKLNE